MGVSEEHIASIFRIQGYSEQKNNMKAGGKHSRWFHVQLIL
jgi:hypothetical protein